MLTIPLLASGRDAEGRAFDSEGSTVSVNRYGARVQVPQLLVAGQTVRLVNLVNKLSSEFRVVGLVGEGENGVKEWGVENQNPEVDFWGIYFPPKSPAQPESTALLECSLCHTVGLLPLSLPEVEALDAGTPVSKFCYQCEADTEWLYPEKTDLEPALLKLPETALAGPVPRRGIEPASPMTSSVSSDSRGTVMASPATLAPVVESRKERRRYVRRPITLQDSSGRADSTRTENLSKNGVCLTSELDYTAGQEVTLFWPHPVTQQSYQARARVVRRHNIGGTARKIYGLEYVSGPVLAAPAPQSVRGLYGGLAALAAATAVLMALAVFRLAAALSVPMDARRALVELSAAFLTLYWGQKTWRAIVERESKYRKPSRRPQRAARAAAATVVAGAILAGVAGIRSGRERAQALRLVSDLSVSDAIERAVDQTESLDFNSPQDYAAACVRLEPLSREWERELGRVSADFSTSALSSGPLRRQISSLLALDRRKLALLRAQIALSGAAGSRPPDKQLAFWQKRFDPLRRQIEQLNRSRGRILQSPAPSE